MDPKPQKYFVCYVDVLGQRDVMQRFAAATGAEAERIRREINAVARELRNFYAGLDEYVRTLRHDPNLQPFFQKNGNYLARSLSKAEFSQALDELEAGVLQFSDSTVFYVSAEQKLGAILFSLGLVRIMREFLRMQSEGVYLRGAIGYGDAWYVKGGQLCGEVLDDVARTEGSYPFYSRIVCTRRYVEFLNAKCEDDASPTFDDAYRFLRDAIGLTPDGVWSVLNHVTKIGMDADSGKGSFDELMGRVIARVRADAMQCRESATREMASGNVSAALKYARINWKYQWLNMWYTYGKPDDQSVPEPSPRPTADNWFDVSDYYVAYLHFREYPTLPKQKGDFEGWVGQSARWATTWKTVDLLAHLLKMLAPAKGASEHFGVQQLHTHVIVYVKKSDGESGSCFVRTMQQFAMVIPVLIQQGVLFRGSLTAGKGWELGRNCLQGPVIADAYDLAIKGAYYSRFMVSNTLIREFEASDMDEVLRNFFKQTVIQDVDGLSAWDYIGMMKFVRFENPADAEKRWQAYFRALVWLNEYGAMLQQIDHPTAAQVALLQELQMLKCGYTRDLRRLAGSDMDLKARMVAADDVAKRLGGVDNAHFDKCFFRP